MELLHYVFFFLVALGVLITFNEAGHFLVARWVGVHVVRFSVGFGKPLLSWRDKRGTEFCVAMLPLGGSSSLLRTGALRPWRFRPAKVVRSMDI